MTIQEKKRILTDPFSKLWNDLWAEDEEKKIKYQKEFYNSEGRRTCQKCGHKMVEDKRFVE